MMMFSLLTDLVILVMDHLSDEGLGLVRPGLGAGLAGGGPVGRPTGVLGVATQQLQHKTVKQSVITRKQLGPF